MNELTPLVCICCSSDEATLWHFATKRRYDGRCSCPVVLLSFWEHRHVFYIHHLLLLLPNYYDAHETRGFTHAVNDCRITCIFKVAGARRASSSILSLMVTNATVAPLAFTSWSVNTEHEVERALHFSNEQSNAELETAESNANTFDVMEWKCYCSTLSPRPFNYTFVNVARPSSLCAYCPQSPSLNLLMPVRSRPPLLTL